MTRQLNKAFVLNEWVPALRSGCYQQGSGYLRRGDTYCCLGVACDLLVQKGVLSGWVRTGEYYHGNTIYQVDGEAGYLPQIAKEYIGFEYVTGEVLYNQQHTSFVILNDEGMSFNDIAEVLERLVSSEE